MGGNDVMVDPLGQSINQSINGYDFFLCCFGMMGAQGCCKGGGNDTAWQAAAELWLPCVAVSP